jgi:hypothetical protein
MQLLQLAFNHSSATVLREAHPEPEQHYVILATSGLLTRWPAQRLATAPRERPDRAIIVS